MNVHVRIRTELRERALDASTQGHQIEADGCSSSTSVIMKHFSPRWVALGHLFASNASFEGTSNPPCSLACLHSSIPARCGAGAGAGPGPGPGPGAGRTRGEDVGGMHRPARVYIGDGGGKGKCASYMGVGDRM